MSLILCYVEPRFALVAADLQVTSVYPDGSKKYMHSADKVIASEGAILAICGQERVSRPARRVLATEGALSGTGIRNALTNVRRHTWAMLEEESREEPSPTTPWRLGESCVFATYTARTGRSGPRACRIGVWNSHANEQLTEVPPGTATENAGPRRYEDLERILAHWHATPRRRPQNIEYAIRSRVARAREVFAQASRAWDWSSIDCRIGIHLAEPEELRLSTILVPGMRLLWAVRKRVLRKRAKWSLERYVLHYGWPAGSSWHMWSWRGADERRQQRAPGLHPLIAHEPNGDPS